MIALLVILIVGITVQHLLVCRRLDEMSRKMDVTATESKRRNVMVIEFMQEEIDGLEKRLDNKIPYKKRQRKVKPSDNSPNSRQSGETKIASEKVKPPVSEPIAQKDEANEQG